MNVIDEMYSSEDLVSNNWEVTIIPTKTLDAGKIKLKVVDINLPFYKLEAERKMSGETYYKNIEDLGPLTLSVRESNGFSTFNFFKKWMDSLFDYEKRVFIVKDTVVRHLLDLEVQFFNPMLTKDTIEYNYPKLSSAKPMSYYRPEYFNREDIPSQKFVFYNCKILGLESLTLDYEGNPIVYSVSLLPETYKLI